MRKYFGTDGVRGKANSELTPELAFKLGRYGGYLLSKDIENPTFVVGRDTRLSGEMLESALISGLMSVGINVVLLGVMPTPGVSFMTKNMNATGGVMISASHNPYEDNGIKFFNKDGFKLSDDIEESIESLIDVEVDSLPRPTENKIGRVIKYYEGQEKYLSYLKTTITNDFKNLKIVLDCANGAASSVAPRLFVDLGAEVTTINNNPDGENINVDCGSTHPEQLVEKVLEMNADIGLAFDGDADRLIAVDDKGQVVDGDSILYVCSKQLKKHNKLNKETVVSTVMSNYGFKKSLEKESIGNIQSNVGDRYVLEKMLESGFNLGGEQSGHIIFLDYNTTGDGVLSGLQLIDSIIESKKSLSNSLLSFEKYPQLLKNVPVKDKSQWDSNETIKEIIEEQERLLNGEGRILVRASGTENLIRVMAEAKNVETVNEVVNKISSVVNTELN